MLVVGLLVALNAASLARAQVVCIGASNTAGSGYGDGVTEREAYRTARFR